METDVEWKGPGHNRTYIYKNAEKSQQQHYSSVAACHNHLHHEYQWATMAIHWFHQLPKVGVDK
jgi:hypothetical protein